MGHAADLVLSQGEDWLAQGLTYTVLAMLERLPKAGVRSASKEALLEAL